MNKIKNVKKAFGFYRPFGFKKNIYMVFQTSDRYKHYQTLQNYYNAEEFQVLSEVMGMMEFNVGPKIIYSQIEHKDFDKKFEELLDKLESDGNTIEKSNRRCKSWPYVTLSTKNFIDVGYLEQLLEHKF